MHKVDENYNDVDDDVGDNDGDDNDDNLANEKRNLSVSVAVQLARTDC